MTAAEIFNVIDNQSVSREDGIRFIENYGIRKAKDAVEELRKISGIEYDPRITELIDSINERLDELLKSTMENAIWKKGEKDHGK